MPEESTGVRIEETTMRAFWSANQAAGVVALTAVGFLVAARYQFRSDLGG